jgi:choline dehydrogenase-like flavoprotein
VADGIFGPGTPRVADLGDRAVIDCDVAIVGAGVGGATLAWALRESGARVLVLEQGDFLPRERENWSALAVHGQGRYKNSQAWIDSGGRPFIPGTYHYVGGCSKLYGATMPRLREADFGEVQLQDGVSPAWPISYSDIEPWYCAAERLYWVHSDGEDPTEPWRSEPFPFPAVPHEPPIARLAERFRDQGLRPFGLPQAVDWREGGRCVLCRTCDSYSCLVDAKGDADVCAMRPALESPDVRLLTNTEVLSIETADAGSRVTHLRARHGVRDVEIRAQRYVVAAGAVNGAALLLRSAREGVANSSGQVGRNYMAHVSSFVVGARPGREHHIQFQKTLGVNDWYHAGSDSPYPLGNVQGLGKLQGITIKAARRWVPLGLLEWITRRSVDFFVESEDLPQAGSRVELDQAGRIHLHWRPTNQGAHDELVKRTARALRGAGYPFIFKQQLGVEATSHQCGTARMGTDPATSVVDPTLRAHDVGNLWIVDASVFPSSAAVNPALTIAALALRAAADPDLATSARSDAASRQGPTLRAAADLTNQG